MIIPTFNRREMLMTRALPSVLNQTYRDIDILVCCHGCTDGTQDAVMTLGDERIRVISIEREQTYPPTAENHWLAGPVAPITAGLRHATGDYIARIDDDDEWDDNHLERLLDELHFEGVEFISSGYRIVKDGKVDSYVVGEGEPKIGGVQTWVYKSYLKFMEPNPECWRKKWNRVNDLDLAERFRQAGVDIGYLDDVTATVRPRPGETSIGSEVYRENAERIERQMAFQQQAGV